MPDVVKEAAFCIVLLLAIALVVKLAGLVYLRPPRRRRRRK